MPSVQLPTFPSTTRGPARLALVIAVWFAMLPASAEAQTEERRLLTILLDYSDIDHTDAFPIEDLRRETYGPGPSVNGMFREMSYGQYEFADEGHWVWVPAWDDPSTPADESTFAHWPSNFQQNEKRSTHALRSLEEAGWAFDDPAKDYGAGDSHIDLRRELAVQVFFEWTPDKGADGAARGVSSNLVLDGMTFSGLVVLLRAVDYPYKLGAHEFGHTVLGLADTYGQQPPICAFTMMGEGYHHLDAYSKASLGWLTPTPVTADGWYALRNSEQFPVAYRLEDPQAPGDEYFLVENRWAGLSYDANPVDPIPDEGLVIWSIDENAPQGNGNGPSRVHLVPRQPPDPLRWPDFCDLWDWSRTAFTAEDADYWGVHDDSAPASLRWRDGSPSGLGVWFSTESDWLMWTYFDVPGVGESVAATPRSIEEATIHREPVESRIHIVNTGDTADSFDVFLDSPHPHLTVDIHTPTIIGLEPRVVREVPFSVWWSGPCIRLQSPQEFAFDLRVESRRDPAQAFQVIPITISVFPEVFPVLTLSPTGREVEPGQRAAYDVHVQNEGGIGGRVQLDLERGAPTEVFRAEHQRIAREWITPTPDPEVSLSACRGESVSYTITVPANWAGFDDATYPFAVEARTASHTSRMEGTLVVKATTASRIRYVSHEIDVDFPDLAEPPLQVKLLRTGEKVNRALVHHLAGRQELMQNMLKAAENNMGAFLHQVDALDGKRIEPQRAELYRIAARRVIVDLQTIRFGRPPLPKLDPKVFQRG